MIAPDPAVCGNPACQDVAELVYHEEAERWLCEACEKLANDTLPQLMFLVRPNGERPWLIVPEAELVDALKDWTQMEHAGDEWMEVRCATMYGYEIVRLEEFDGW